jgi:hypothetical protein
MNFRTSLFALLFTLTATACDEATPAATHADPARGSLGKADAIEGSCAATEDDGDVCGGPAPVGNCWCDESCESYGDCCSDSFDACGVGEPEPQVSQCFTDAHCDAGQTCAGGVCIGAPSCDDGTSLHPLCDIKPVCPGEQVAAVINGCFQCVDSDTCEPPAPASCNDGTQLSPFCDVPPLCDAGTTKAILNSCFSCVDPQTCEPV